MEIRTGRIFKRLQKVEKKHRIVFLRGGARSGKSFCVMQLMTIWLYTGWLLGEYIPEGSWTTIRATFPALRATVLRDFVQYLHELDIYKHIEHIKTINEFHYNKRQVDFIPADNEQKLRGRKHTIAWLEEVNDLPYDIFTQVNLRLSHKMFMTVNPSGEPWAKTEIEDKRMRLVNDVFLDISTFNDNPFLEQSVIDEIEKLEFLDKDLYQIYNLGIWTKLKGLIYPNVSIVDYMPIGRDWKVFHGLDLGFVDPCALVEVKIKGKEMYIDLLLYQNKLLVDELANKINSINGNPRIMCDSAEPRTIEEMRKRGVNARAAKKGADSVRQRIMFIKQHNIYVTSNSLELLSEWKKFSWDKEKDGRLKDVPINKYKHSSDAVSYAISNAMRVGLKFLT